MTSDLFTGAADYYAQYRPNYPEALYAVARAAFGLDGPPHGTLLDLGTGPGFIALQLADAFERVIGLDTDPGMLHLAHAAVEARGLRHTTWHELRAEDLDTLDGTPSGGPYRLVTIGSALHWMDQSRVLSLVRERLAPNGGIFLAGFPGFIEFDLPAEDDLLSRLTVPVIRRYLGAERRAGSGTFRAPLRPWQEQLKENGFADVTSGSVPLAVDFTYEQVRGLLYSTSFASRHLLGDRIGAFESDLRVAFDDAAPDGTIRRIFETDWVIGRP